MRIYTVEAHIDGGHTVGVRRRLQKSSQELHRHEFIELVYILSGSAVQRVDDATFEVSRGDMLFINYGSRHAFDPTPELEYVNIYFMPDLLGEAMINPENALAALSLTSFDEMRKDKNGGMITFSGDERREVEFIISAMLSECESSALDSRQVLEHYLCILFTKMLSKTALRVQGDSFSNVWEELESYIDENLSEELTLSSLAKKSFYNPSYFSRIFKQKFGMALSDYVRIRRMEQAEYLLRETDLSVDEIVRTIGYADRSAFHHAFVKHAGASPAEFRARNKVK